MNKPILLLAGIALACTGGCFSPGKQEKTKSNSAPMSHDPHSWSRPSEAVVKHLSLDIAVDFDSATISGTASWDIENKTGTDSLHLDCRHMDILSVKDETAGKETGFTVGPEDPLMGRALSVAITPETRRISIRYATHKGAGALQFLSPAQTSGKAHPFLFTQSQAILARTWIPIQDSPGIRFTYEATVKVPAELRAAMSAENVADQKLPAGVFRFRMEQPIPSYLMALAVGDISFRKIGERTGVYAESNLIAKAEYEFGEMENMLVAAEKLYGEYKWGRYDVIVLPPSFPFGGMENPRLTFATPTILAGDRSLTSLIAHEMAHSWSGNLVTNATWNDFWLNEGFTVYFEQRIMEAIYGRAFSEMEAILAKQELEETIRDLDEKHPDDTRLKIDLAGRNPDDGLTDVAYIKGYFLLRLMEESAGREKFDAFLKAWFTKNAFTSRTTEDFVAFAKAHLTGSDSALAKKIDMETWIYQRGLPATCPVPVSDKLTNVDAEVTRWKNGTLPSLLATRGWSTQEWLHFLRALPDSLTQAQMESLNGAFSFNSTGNSEIMCDWLLHVIRSGYEPGYRPLEEFLFTVGRRKFIKPLYAELIRTEKGKEMALKLYRRSRPNYHFIAQVTLDDMLGFQP